VFEVAREREARGKEVKNRTRKRGGGGGKRTLFGPLGPAVRAIRAARSAIGSPPAKEGLCVSPT
jgi:hypothetical protein